MPNSYNEILIWLSNSPNEYHRKMAEGIRRGYEQARDEDWERKDRKYILELEKELLESDPLRVYLRVLREDKRK